MLVYTKIALQLCEKKFVDFSRFFAIFAGLRRSLPVPPHFFSKPAPAKTGKDRHLRFCSKLSHKGIRDSNAS